jgi:hypothetical protein
LNRAEVTEVFYAFGHANVRATHRSTLEITKDMHLSRTGDCIIAVASQKTLPDLSCEFKKALRRPNARLLITIEVDGSMDRINAYGSPDLLLTHNLDMVISKSDHIDSRTFGILSDKAANDLSRRLIEKLRDPKQKARITLTVNF